LISSNAYFSADEKRQQYLISRVKSSFGLNKNTVCSTCNT
jgi:hypothetical protein